MILQKLASAIRRQDWFQVLIEMLIVIVGIYLGLQVTEWADERERKVQERTYFERLHQEIINLTKGNQAYRTGNNFYFGKLAELTEAITTGNTDILLDEDHCKAAGVSTEYVSQAISTPAMTELINSGQISVLSDQALKTEIASYIIARDQAEDIFDNIRADKKDLASIYPDVIKIGYANSNRQPVASVSAVCDFDHSK